MSRRFQFSLKWLFVAMLAVACFFGGIRFERERRRHLAETWHAAIAKRAHEIEMQRVQENITAP